MSEDGKGRVISDQERQLYYGTFQGVANYYPPPPQPPTQPVVGVLSLFLLQDSPEIPSTINLNILIPMDTKPFKRFYN
ncbi:hypothetical protein CJ030_MR2G005413 [Morella rubra]|uniref:Uncharacterized protein n=1 Tax=Morella rubra TaxID=262757 RepID=A0A6A1WAK9_9ROSI|nr:hypothetical protein CJ030_MR2G005413 [Morella rubra]